MSLLNELPKAGQKSGWAWTKEVDPQVYAGKRWPKISIVTPSYNQGNFIEETIRSILLQNYPNLELIIMDGGSTDNTVPIIRKYEKWITSWVSEKDNGQADAINKGVEKCTGEIFNWINTDDFLAANSLITIGQLFEQGGTVAGAVVNFYDDDPNFMDVITNKDLEIGKFLSLKSEFHQPGVWCSLNNFKANGKLPQSYSYYFDRIFFTGYFQRYPEIIYTDSILVHFRYHNDSKTVVIKNNKITEMIGFYTGLLANPLFKSYRKYILKALKTKLLPELHVSAWEIGNNESSVIKRRITYFRLLLKYPSLLRSRYFFTKLKAV